MFDKLWRGADSAAVVTAIAESARAEAAATARRLAAIAELVARRADGPTDSGQWSCDNWDAIAAEVAAALNISHSKASGQMYLAVALRDRLPAVGALLAEGSISSQLAQTIVWHTYLIKDPQALQIVDAGEADRPRILQEFASAFDADVGGYENIPQEPPKAMTDGEIAEHITRYRSELETRWQETLDYLAGVSLAVVHFRITNGARSFLDNVEVIITFEDVEGVEHAGVESFRFEKLRDLDWQEPDPYGVHSFRLAPPAGYPITWRNVEGNLRVRIKLPELRPTPPWESEEECADDVVLVLRDTELESVAVAFTVTADSYGEAFEGTLTVPVERISAMEAVNSAVAIERNQPRRCLHRRSIRCVPDAV